MTDRREFLGSVAALGLSFLHLRPDLYDSDAVCADDLPFSDVDTSLTTLDISSWDVSAVTDMSRMFQSTPLTTLDVKQFGL